MVEALTGEVQPQAAVATPAALALRQKNRALVSEVCITLYVALVSAVYITLYTHTRV